MTDALPPLTELEYQVACDFIRQFDAAEERYRKASGRRGFRDADLEALRKAEAHVATLRAAVEGYEAAHRS